MHGQIETDHVDVIFNYWMQDEDISRYMYWKVSKDIKETQEFIHYELGNIENDEWYR